MNYIIVKADYKVDPKFRKEVVTITKEVSRLFGMTEWDIQIKINGSKCHRPSEHGPGMSIAADINSNHIYQNAFVNIYPEIYDNWKLKLNKYILHFAIAHELMHCLFQKIQVLAKSRFITPLELDEEIENKTQIISRLICKLSYDITEDKYIDSHNSTLPSRSKYENCNSKRRNKPRKNRKLQPGRQRKNRSSKNG